MSLYWACGLTMLMETGYFLLRGYRGRDFVILCLAANAVTNLSLNLLLGYWGRPLWLIVLLELAAAGLEYAVYRPVVGPKKALLPDTLAANLVSLVLGGVLLRLMMGLSPGVVS